MNGKNAISNSENGTLIKVHVTPSSSQSVFPASYNDWRGCLEIKVKAEAKENKANNEVIERIAEYFNISPKDISIVTGHKDRNKTISIKNVEIDDVRKKLRSL